MKTVIYKNPIPAVDIIVNLRDSIVLIERAEIPLGWALPGGFVCYGESFEECAIREAFEEISLNVKLIEQFYTYSNPNRDPRQHIVSTVFIAVADGIPKASDDAKRVGIFERNNLPSPIVFDHKQILSDYFNYMDDVSRNDVFKKYLQVNINHKSF